MCCPGVSWFHRSPEFNRWKLCSQSSTWQKYAKAWETLEWEQPFPKAQVSFVFFPLTLRLKGNYSTLPQQLSQCFRDHSLSFRDRDFPNKTSASFRDHIFWSFASATTVRRLFGDLYDVDLIKCPAKYKIKSSFRNLPRREPFREASAAFRGLNPVHFSKNNFHRKHTDITEEKNRNSGRDLSHAAGKQVMHSCRNVSERPLPPIWS